MQRKHYCRGNGLVLQTNSNKCDILQVVDPKLKVNPVDIQDNNDIRWKKMYIYSDKVKQGIEYRTLSIPMCHSTKCSKIIPSERSWRGSGCWFYPVLPSVRNGHPSMILLLGLFILNSHIWYMIHWYRHFHYTVLLKLHWANDLGCLSSPGRYQ